MKQALQLGFQSVINIRRLTVFPRTLKAGAFVILKAGAMGSKRLHSNLGESGLPTTDTIKKEKKLRGSMGLTPQSENGAIKGIAGNNNRIDIQSMRDDLGKLDMMTVQELRTTLRSIGVPAKGCKRDLVSTLKCFLNSNVDGGDDEYISSEMKPSCSESAPLKKKSKNANSVCNKNIQDIKIVGEVSGLQQSKGRGKQFPVEDGRAEVNAHLVTTNQKLSIKTEVSGKKASQSKRKVSSEISLEDVRTSYQDDRSMNQTEPWTVLSHMKPQQGWIAYNPRTMRPPPPMGDTKFVKLMSWNVNGLRALLKLEGFSALELAQREDFDVLCLQETKLQEKDVEAVKQRLIDGYENSFWTCSVSKLGYSGTAIISRIKPLSVRYGLGISDHDSEGRVVTAEFDTFYLMSGYIPNSGDGLKRLSYRVTQWDLSLSNYMKELEKSKPVILTGDLNCAHQEIDIYNPAGNKRSAGFTDEERKSFEKNFLSRGFVDTFRKQHPGVVGYTYWGYRHGARKTNKGWRLDYFLVSESIADKVHDSYILPDVGGSDHCPIGLILEL